MTGSCIITKVQQLAKFHILRSKEQQFSPYTLPMQTDGHFNGASLEPAGALFLGPYSVRTYTSN